MQFWGKIYIFKLDLYEFIDTVQVVVCARSLLGYEALLQRGQPAVHIMLQTRLRTENDQEGRSNTLKSSMADMLPLCMIGVKKREDKLAAFTWLGSYNYLLISNSESMTQ